ncbi:c-type cytochrome [Pseudomonas sp. F1_0610]|uniref:c-type cytochrome n=1 Tax=Pseudomonas sp. F1_0610 TaxID=3114284 RepID=UPI0039C1608D
MNLMKKILVAQATVVTLWAASAMAATESDDAAIAERISPLSTVCLAGEPCAKAAPVVAAASGGARTGEEVYNKFCTTCHATGLLDAPKKGDTAAWKQRADEQGGLDSLLKQAIQGFNAMPPKGTCSDCSDDELKSAIQFMSGL